jgi:N6-adenosine-specific RNA methylase IME4
MLDLSAIPPVRVIVADPPWSFNDKLPASTHSERGAEGNYSVLKQPEIESFLVDHRVFVAADAILFLWRVSSQVEEAYCVVRAWGFTPKSEIVWVKTPRRRDEPNYDAHQEEPPEKLHFGMGRYVRAAHETCVVAVRGRFPVADRSVRSVFFAPVRAHSEKPNVFFGMVERLVGAEPERLEVFGRKERAGWHVIGDELPGGYVSASGERIG